MPDTLPAPAALAAQSAALSRRPALPGFLARSVLSWNWLDGVPDAWSLRWILKACEAELSWSRADFNRLSKYFDSHVEQYDGPHPEQAHRLPHERMAARVLNAWGYAGDNSRRIRELVLTLKAQREAANDLTQDEDYRKQWFGVSTTTEKQIADLWKRRHEAWRVLLAAMKAYRALREEIGDMKEVA